jgi:hypothetical protein
MRVSDEYLHFMMKRLRESSSSLIAEKETHERLTQAEDACSLVAMIEFDDACLLAPVFATVKILMKVPGKYSNRQRHLLLLLLTLTSFLPKFSNQPKASLFFRVNIPVWRKDFESCCRHHHQASSLRPHYPPAGGFVL